jgi:NAD(P)-dependent dehydrogenase (short-subunit alcohol dehydrogenase family)
MYSTYMAAAINPLDLTGRRVLVTGASSGIGRETAILLSRLGASLTVAGRDENRLADTVARLEGEGHSAASFDISRLDAIPAWVKQLAAGGPFDGLVHSAGIHQAAPLRVLNPAAMEDVMRTNVLSAAFLAKGFRQKGCRADAASIVLLSSVAGLAGEPGIAAYSASKAAIAGLARSLAVELAPERIRVNAIAPGFVRSEMGDRLKEFLTPEQFEAIERNHPLGTGTPGDVANGAAFLISDAARWITGTTLVMDGGYTAH